MAHNAHNKRIAQNTLFMYFRMFITMGVGLYTSRVILEALGVVDYGLSNVIGGIIGMFAFVNGAMANATSRYITYNLGRDDHDQVNQAFNMALLIHFAIALLIVVIGETIGLWYLNNKMVIPVDRMNAAQWLYQLTIATAVVNIISVPYNAAIVANERMKAYAYMSILDVLLKLLICYIIMLAPFDRLVFYAVLMFLIHLFERFLYSYYCQKSFTDIYYKFYWNKAYFKEMFGYAGWNMFGNISYVFYHQGINLVLNYYCGPAVNAARGISQRVESVVKQFASNVQTAINPQIIKSYAKEDNSRMFTLIFASSRYCYYLLFMLAMPIMLEAPTILSIWLGNVPDHTINFMRITIWVILLESFNNPLWTANNATGKVRNYQLAVSINSYLFIPFVFVAIKYTGIPETALLVYLLSRINGVFVRVAIMRKTIKLPACSFLKNVILRVVIVSVISAAFPLVLHNYFPDNLIYTVLNIVVCEISILITIYTIGIDSSERMFLNNKIALIIKNKLHLE